MINKENIVCQFISKLKEKYGSLIYVEYKFNHDINEYEIWHNNSDLQFKDADFRTFVGQLIKELFYNNGIFDFSFGYDYFKSKNLLYNEPRKNDFLHFNEPSFSTNVTKTIFVQTSNSNTSIVNYKFATDIVRNDKLPDYHSLPRSNSFKDNQVFTQVEYISAA